MLDTIAEQLSRAIEKKQKDDLYRKREENFRITLHSIGDGVISTDNKGNIVYMNRAAEKLTGWNFHEAQGRYLTHVFRIFNAQTKEPADNPVDYVIKTGKVLGLADHTMLVSKDGAHYQIADSAAPILDDDKNIHGVVLVFRDVTEDYNMPSTRRK